MRISKLRRVGSGLLAAVIAMSMYVGAALPAAAAAVGDDGSAEMNEAYAAHESLMPIGPSFNVNTLLEWTPESDPDARYSRASVALTDRTGGFVVNPKANPEAKLMLCSLANSAHDTTSAQGTEDFMSWAFNYWQYADSFVYWSGSEEGIICCPTGEFTDAAHTNGVPVVATLGFPWGSGTGYADQVSAFCQQAEDGSFPVADKLLEVMEYYGFDGYFFNQESYGCSSEIAARLNAMMKYMRKKCPDILISWYDSMIPSGGVSYQNAVNSSNQAWMEPDESGNYCVDEFFMNYNWYESQISTTVSTMNAIGRSPFAAFAGLDVQQNCMSTGFRDYLLLDANGRMKISFALYCPNSTLGLSTSGADFHEVEQDFYVNTASDPRVETSDPTVSSNSAWVGMSRFFADKTPITSAPFVTNFNSGHGTGYWVDGVLSRNAEWSYQSNQDVMPTWTWIIDSEGSKLAGGYDFTDAFNGGNSIKFEGALEAGKANDIMLYSTDIAVTNGMKMSLTYKNDDGKMKLVAYYGDDTTTSYEDCTKVAYDLTAGEADAWTTTSVDLSASAGKTLFAVGMQIESSTAVSDYKVNLGQLAITEQDRAALSGPSAVTLDEIMYHSAYEAEARIYWNTVEEASSYEVYKVNADGASSLIMETPNTALYLPTVIREADEENVTLKVVPINKNGIRGAGKTLVIDWLYGNDDSEAYEKIDFENVCLNAEVTDVSFQNDGEPASKALDGTSANNSKWCATNRSTGYMSINIGREVTVKRWRVEHAEYGGEAHNMNTIDFALEYKDASGAWVQAKRIQNNTLAVTDVLLDTPVTASEWKLVIYNDGSSPWGGIRIYEWQMFETDQFPQTDPVMMHFASAVNNAGADDTFTLTHVPAGQTVKVYTKSGDEYTLIGEQTAEDTTVVITGLDFGTAEAGRVYYTTTAVGSAESIKQSAPFEAETAEKSAPAQNVSFVKYSQPDSVTSSNGDDIYTTMTVNDLAPGDVVYVYEAESETWTKMSQPVAEGETSVSISGVKVVRAGGTLTMQIKRAGKLISDKYTISTPQFAEPTATVRLIAFNAAGESLAGVTYGVYNASGTRVGEIVTAASGGTAVVELGVYTLKCESAPEGYRVNNTPVTTIVRTEAQTYEVNVTIQSDSLVPTVTSVTVTPAAVSVEKGKTQQFTAAVTGENDPNTEVTWTVEGAATAATVIDADGLLTVGENETANTLTVTATSVQDTAKSASATVTVMQGASETENVALGAEVIAYNGNNLGGASGPEKLFDGKWEDSDADKWGVDGNNKWVAFDIGEERDVTELKLIHAGAANEWSPAPGQINTAGYEFYVLDESKISVEELLSKTYEERCTLLEDSSYWKLIASTTDNLDDITTNDLTGTTGRIFKINISRTDTTGWGQHVRVYELELYSPVPVPESVLLSGNADVLGSSKTPFTGEEEDNAFDGDYGTKWCALTPNWLVFDIGTAATPNRLKVTHANGATEPEGATFNTVAFALQMLDTSKLSEADFLAKTESERAAIMADDSYWTAIQSYTNNTLDVTDDVLEVSKSGRIYRFVVTDGDNSNWQDTLRVYEIELFGVKNSAVSADKTALNALIAQADLLSESAYTPNSWNGFAEALAEAKTVAADASADQAAVDAAEEALQTAMDALITRADKDSLWEAIWIAENDVEEEDFTPESYAEFAEVLENVKEIANDPNATQAQVSEAYDALINAIFNILVERADTSALEALIANAEAREEEAYTTDTWEALSEALASAKTVADNANASQAEVDAAAETLQAALDALVERADTSALEALIADAEAREEEAYVTDTWEALSEALASAKTVAGNVNAPQEEVDAAAETLQAALDALVARGDKTALQEEVDLVDLDPAELPEDFPLTAEFMNALANAKAVLADEDATQDEIDAAYDELVASEELQMSAAMLYGVIVGIDEVVDEGLDQSFTSESWAALMEEYENAKAMLENVDETTAEELTAQIEKIGEMIEALVPAGDSDALAGLIETAKKEDLDKYTDESAEAIREAIAKAEEVIANRGTEEELDEAYVALEKALTEAELKPVIPEKPDTPDTGDYAPIALPVVLTALAAGMFLLKKKRSAR